jgi:Arc/MetJ-type ribon-helix-helix transcriptional regulator
MSDKGRLSVTVDPQLVAAARQAVTDGRAASVSAWVNEALRRQVDHERRLRALGEFIAEFESTHGVITGEDMDKAQRSMHERAVVVRGKPRRRSRGAA